MKTQFKNFLYLKKSLDKLKIPSFKIPKTDDLILLKTKQNDLSFNWNGQYFVLHVDYGWWNQKYSFSHFLNRIKKEYVIEMVIGECQNFGFLPTLIKQTLKGNRILSMQRFNENGG